MTQITALSMRQDAYAMAATALTAMDEQSTLLTDDTANAADFILDLQTKTKSADGSILPKDLRPLKEVQAKYVQTLATAFATRDFAEKTLNEIAKARELNAKLSETRLTSKDLTVLGLLDVHGEFLERTDRARKALTNLDMYAKRIDSARAAFIKSCRALGTQLDTIKGMVDASNVNTKGFGGYALNALRGAMRNPAIYEDVKRWAKDEALAGAGDTTPLEKTLQEVAQEAGVGQKQCLEKLQTSKERPEEPPIESSTETTTYDTLSAGMKAIVNSVKKSAAKVLPFMGSTFTELTALKAEIETGGSLTTVTTRFNRLVDPLSIADKDLEKVRNAFEASKQLVSQVHPLELSETARTTLDQLGVDISENTANAERKIALISAQHARLLGCNSAIDCVEPTVRVLIKELDSIVNPVVVKATAAPIPESP